jgi:hypothetical protein
MDQPYMLVRVLYCGIGNAQYCWWEGDKRPDPNTMYGRQVHRHGRPEYRVVAGEFDFRNPRHFQRFCERTSRAPVG